MGCDKARAHIEAESYIIEDTTRSGSYGYNHEQDGIKVIDKEEALKAIEIAEKEIQAGRPTPIRTLEEIQEYLNNRFLAPYQNIQVMYGAMRVFYDLEAVEGAHITPRFLPSPLRLLLPPYAGKNATDEAKKVYQEGMAALEQIEEYNICMQNSYTVEDFIDWLSIPD